MVAIAKRVSDVMTVFLKHILETKTSPRSPLVLSEYADVV